MEMKYAEKKGQGSYQGFKYFKNEQMMPPRELSQMGELICDVCFEHVEFDVTYFSLELQPK